MGIVFGIAAVLLLVALAGKDETPAPTKSEPGVAGSDPKPRALPPFVKQVLTNGNASKDDLARAALQAKEAGYPKLSHALAKRIAGGKNLIASPWKDVSDAAWTRFARVISNGHKPDSVNPKGFYGIFQIGVRRLVDLGLMKDPQSKMATNKKDPAKKIRVWKGTWVIPEEKFLSDPQLQYQTFAKSMELFRSIIAEKYAQVLGLNIEGMPATLSGLLALAHTAGPDGMHKWLLNGDLRNKFTWVTAAYKQANGIF